MKIRSDDEIDAYNKDKFEAEKVELKEVDGFTLIDYIKQSIEMLMNMKMEETNPEPPMPKSKQRKVKKEKDKRYKNIDEPDFDVKLPHNAKETIDSKMETQFMKELISGNSGDEVMLDEGSVKKGEVVIT